MISTVQQAKATDSVLAGTRTIVAESVDDPSSVERLVLVHGSMDRQAGFLKLARILSNSFEVTLYDRRGYASSSDVPGPFGIAHHVEDLVAVIGSKPAIVIGHSFGGTVALVCAVHNPELVRGVVTYENPMPWLEWWPTDTGAGQASRRTEDPELAAQEFLIRFIGQRLWDRLPEATKRERRQEGRALVDELASIHTSPAFDAAAISVPVSIGVGSLARDYMRRGAEFLAERADSRLAVLDGAHHNAHSSRPAEYVEQLVVHMDIRLRPGAWPAV
ncbi:MAG: alpha/beta fold hydrolase [Actinomycetota bacterium]